MDASRGWARVGADIGAEVGRLGRRVLLSLWALASAALAAPGGIMDLRVDGIIGPASADFIVRGLAKAAEEEARLVVIELDTPGGLDTAMRQIIKAILASPVPVVTYVSPSGARAASAGTYILYASHIAAMAPGTNVGAATPVAIGMTPESGEKKPEGEKGKSGKDAKEAPPSTADTMSHKARNDATAYLRSLAEMRGRNVDFAERAVREAASLGAEAAKRQGVIDLVAQDLPDLLRQIDGRKLRFHNGDIRLATAGVAVVTLEPDWRNRVLAVLAHPQLALILMSIGMYGLIFEFTNPGSVLPGVVGAICLLLALFAFQLLPINWTGVALLALGAGLMITEAFMPSFGVIGLGGVVAFVLGGLFLIDAELPGYGLPLPLVLGTAAVSAIVLFGIGSLAARSRRRPVVSGREALVGSRGTVTVAGETGCWARVQGESWRVRSSVPLVPGDELRVTGVDGLILEVEPLGREEQDDRR
jgi:membrane-bound serine protease (ClpP class)